jgi:hypothetical protein
LSTRFTKSESDGVSVSTGYEGSNVVEDIEVPPCTIEDVDRVIFNLFNDEIPLYYTHKGDSKRIPVIFATGERFAILRRKRPLRDKSGTLILPLISIMRSGIDQDVSRGLGPGQGGPIIIKQKLSENDAQYQQVINHLNLKNQDNLNTITHFINEDRKIDALPGTVASRRSAAKTPLAALQGNLLEPNLNKNITEIWELPPVKHYNASYEITFWSQYTQQMNNMLSSVMSSYQDNRRRTFRLETPEGYWFVAYVIGSMTPGNNYDDFADNERIVRYSFNIDVPAYLVIPQFPGAPAAIRKYLSAPDVSFDVSSTSAMTSPKKGSVPSGDPGSYMLEDLATVSDPLPGANVGESASANSLMPTNYIRPNGAAVATRDSNQILDGKSAALKPDSESTIGTTRTSDGYIELMTFVTDPFTGVQVNKKVKIKSRNERKGETVLGGVVADNLENL